MSITAVSADNVTHEFPDGTNPAVIDKVMKDYATQKQPGGTPAEPPSTVDRLVASPVGRLVQENVVAPAIGLGTMLSHAVTSDPRVDTIQNSEEKGYQGALARNRNTPGYPAALQEARQAQQGMSADAEAFVPSVQSAIAGTVGLTGGLDTSNAMADVATERQDAYQKAHPVLSTAQALAGSLATAPEGGLPKITRAPIPTAEQIKSKSSAAYKAARESGLEIAPQPVTDMVQAAKNDLVDEGFDPVLHPNTARALQRLEQIGTDPKLATVSLKQLDTERKVAGRASQSSATNPSDAHMAGIIQDHIDNLVENLSPDQIASGDQAATQQITEARQAWRTAKKSEMIGTAFERAANQAGGYTQSGFGNALRTQFKQIADNPKRFNSFSDAEKKGILKVVRGGKAQDALRWLGKLAPRGVVSLMADMGIGAATGGSAVPFMVLGEGARAASTAMKVRDANRLAELVRAGGDEAALAPQIAPVANAMRQPTGAYAIPGVNALIQNDRRNALAAYGQ